MHFDPISHQPTTIQSFVQSTSSTNQMQINFASLSTHLESTANAPPVPSVLAQCLPSVSQPNAQVELGSDLNQDLYRRPESMFVAIKVEVETTPTEGDEPNKPANDAQNQSRTTKQAKTRKRKSLTTESCSLENSSTSREVSTPGPKKKSKRARVASQLDRPETVEEVSAAIGVDLSEVDEENGGGGLGLIQDDNNETELAEEDGGHYKIEVVKLKCTEENCEEEFASRDELHDHLRDYHHTSPYRCLAEGCLERFEQRTELGNHVQHNHSNISIWTCAHCTKTFNTHRRLCQHLHYYHFEGQFKCGYDGCHYDQVATLRSEIKSHQQSEHPSTTIFTCPFHNCGKSFNLNGNLKVHQRIHTAVKPYPCGWTGCGKSFTRKECLNNHQRIHQGVKPFKCTWNMCGYAATTQSAVIRHIRTKHFLLPATQQQQHQRGIEDNRNPYDYLQQKHIINPPM